MTEATNDSSSTAALLEQLKRLEQKNDRLQRERDELAADASWFGVVLFGLRSASNALRANVDTPVLFVGHRQHYVSEAATRVKEALEAAEEMKLRRYIETTDV